MNCLVYYGLTGPHLELSLKKLHSLLTYGAEVVILTEIGLLSSRVQNFITRNNNDEFRFNLDLLE